MRVGNDREFEPLDIVACFGTAATDRAISCLTGSLLAPSRLRLGPSHVAVLCYWRDQPLWIESTTLCAHPCVIQGQVVSGTQAHYPEDRIQDYVRAGGRVDLYRLSPFERLSKEEGSLLTQLLMHFVGRSVTYDLGGALLSGTRLFKHTSLLPAADLNSLFCSELVAAICMRLGKLARTNPTRFHPAGLLRSLVRAGTVGWHRTWQGTL